MSSSQIENAVATQYTKYILHKQLQQLKLELLRLQTRAIENKIRSKSD